MADGCHESRTSASASGVDVHLPRSDVIRTGLSVTAIAAVNPRATITFGVSASISEINHGLQARISLIFGF